MDPETFFTPQQQQQARTQQPQQPQQPEPQPQTPNPNPPAQPNQPAGGADPQPERTFTQAEVDAMVTGRVATLTRTQRAQLRAELQQEQAEQQRQAQLPEMERITSERDAAARERDELRSRSERAERMVALIGQVRDPEAAVALIDPERHMNQDGTVNVTALLERFPFLAPEPTTPQPNRPNPVTVTNPPSSPRGGPTTLYEALREESRQRP